jgi:hypothetical protein
VSLPAQEQITFEDFWALFPRHVAKKDALKAWIQTDPALHVEILTSLVAWRKVWLDRNEIQYVPYPATWLRGERWTDELPVSMSHASHQPVVLDRKPKGELPAHVKEAIARLKR